MELIILAVQIIQVVVSILLILVILLQPGKSGDLGSIFGGGTSESVFGAAGAVPFLAKLTRGLAVLFMISSLTLGYFAAKGVSKSVVTDVSPPAAEQTMGDTEAPQDVTTAPGDGEQGADVSSEPSMETGEGAETQAEGTSLESDAPSEAQDSGESDTSDVTEIGNPKSQEEPQESSQ